MVAAGQDLMSYSARRRAHCAKGGPVILVQPDIEPNLVFTYGIDGSLYDEHVTGPGGLWARWRAEGGIEPAPAPVARVGPS